MRRFRTSRTVKDYSFNSLNYIVQNFHRLRRPFIDKCTHPKYLNNQIHDISLTLRWLCEELPLTRRDEMNMNNIVLGDVKEQTQTAPLDTARISQIWKALLKKAPVTVVGPMARKLYQVPVPVLSQESPVDAQNIHTIPWDVAFQRRPAFAS